MQASIAVIGLGYVGFPLAVEFGKLYPTLGFDIDQARLTLRGDLGLAVDRGRIVRESIAVIVADLEAKGDQSILARRLRGI